MSDIMNFAGFEQNVREAAYFLWENEGRPSGRHVEHWLISEEALQSQQAAVTAPEAAEITAAVEVAEPRQVAPAAADYIAAPKVAPAKPKKLAAKPTAIATKPKAASAKKKPTLVAKRGAAIQEISATLQ